MKSFLVLLVILGFCKGQINEQSDQKAQESYEYVQPIPIMITFAILVEDYLYIAYSEVRNKDPYNIILFYIILAYLLYRILKGNKQTSYIIHSTKIIDTKTQETLAKLLDARNQSFQNELTNLKSSIKPIKMNLEPNINIVPEIAKILNELIDIENTHKEFEEEIHASHQEILEELQYLTIDTLKPPDPESAGPDSHMPSDEEN